jgi:5'-nucleotidase
LKTGKEERERSMRGRIAIYSDPLSEWAEEFVASLDWNEIFGKQRVSWYCCAFYPLPEVVMYVSVGDRDCYSDAGESVLKISRVDLPGSLHPDLFKEDGAKRLRLEAVKRTRPVVLIDMDNTLVNFSKKFEEVWLRKHPEKDLDHSTYFMWDAVKHHYSPEELVAVRREMEDMMCAKDFFRSMEAMEGAAEAFSELRRVGFSVWVCTSPWVDSEYSIGDKDAWCKKHLDEKTHLITTQDKTMIRGDVLIDDKPTISGLMRPKWTQVLYDRPYNRQETDRKRIERWRDAVNVVLSVLFDSE